MSTTTSKSLEIQIEELIRGHIAASRRAATAAVERAFGSVGSAGAKEKRLLAAPAKRATGRRRTGDEVNALGERFYEAVCANPGVLMITLAEHLGMPSSELNRPATVLRKKGRIRSVGRRQGTRYFPMAGKTAGKS
jgi:hypothetical protein